jgi:hypothetical protein
MNVNRFIFIFFWAINILSADPLALSEVSKGTEVFGSTVTSSNGTPRNGTSGGDSLEVKDSSESEASPTKRLEDGVSELMAEIISLQSGLSQNIERFAARYGLPHQRADRPRTEPALIKTDFDQPTSKAQDLTKTELSTASLKDNVTRLTEVVIGQREEMSSLLRIVDRLTNAMKAMLLEPR